MGLKDLASGFGKVLALTGALGASEAAAEDKTATDMQVAATYAGVEDCGLYLREKIVASQKTETPITRSEAAHMLADCRNAQLQATLKEQEAILAEQEATLAGQEAILAEQDATLAEQDRALAEAEAEANADLARQGLKIEDGKLFDLEGQLLGIFTNLNGEVSLDLSPMEARTQALEAQARQSLADLETFLMHSINGKTSNSSQ